MATVRYTADGGHYRVGGHGFDPGDEREVGEELAEYLADVDDFEVVDGGLSEAELDPDDVVDEMEGDDPPDDEGDDAETCDEVKSDGEVCGRDLPCPYHSDEDDNEQEG
ncbi:hypothetical protein [Halosimplex pelagicum]|uniref:Uncharacterized protein YqbF N-terminal domain-containing protein n=1 Tax=Halosimplex pelagicum TaxID=869886 RepID=A0A7D5TB42_9EURY|nr:hypothetical protein [Halosimplex pelagicum]QLH80975.1 hypothetical protein HZS54_04695 [Halosimplex pelagicum]